MHSVNTPPSVERQQSFKSVTMKLQDKHKLIVYHPLIQPLISLQVLVHPADTTTDASRAENQVRLKSRATEHRFRDHQDNRMMEAQRQANIGALRCATMQKMSRN